jgi:hypothetical protein
MEMIEATTLGFYRLRHLLDKRAVDLQRVYRQLRL